MIYKINVGRKSALDPSNIFEQRNENIRITEWHKVVCMTSPKTKIFWGTSFIEAHLQYINMVHNDIYKKCRK